MREIIIPICIALICSIRASAQSDTSVMITNFVNRTLAISEVVPSVSIAVVSDTEVLYQRAFGYRNMLTREEATDQCIYYIASCTKAYNGLLAHILHAEGHIDLYAPILDYKPFSDFERQELFQDITIMDLISHQSGIDNPYLSFRLAYSGEYSHDQIVELIESESRENESGKQFEYSNYGYYLFDYLLQAELGKSWRDLLDEKVFQPLNMTSTTAYASKVDESMLALPHVGVFKDAVDVASLQKTDELMHAAGGLMTNAEDVAKFLQFYLSKGNGIYSEQLIEASYEPRVDTDHEYIRLFQGQGYASGWRTGTFENEKVVYHFGGYTGYFAHISFLPEQNIGMAVFVNSDMGMVAANLIAKYIYNLYLGNGKEIKAAEKILSKKVPKALAGERKSHVAHEKKLAERTWNLTLPKASYAGAYYSDKLGSVEVTLDGDQLVVQAGKLRTHATAFPVANTMRVELVPGSGTIISFMVEGDAVTGMSHQREVFDKVGD